MAGFTSFDDYMNQSTVNGKRRRVDWQKSFLPTTPAVAGEWHCLARGAGNPAADALYNTTTTLHFQQLSYETQTAAFHGALPYGGVVGATGADYKQIVAAAAWTTAATTAPGVLMLVDLLGFVRNTAFGAATDTIIDHEPTCTAVAGTDIVTNTTLTMLNGTKFQFTGPTPPAGVTTGVDYWSILQTATTFKVAATYADAIAGTAIDLTTNGTTFGLQTYLPRYTNGAGVQAFAWVNNATPRGAGTPNMSINYTNAAGTAGRATPTVLPIGKTAAANGLIEYSGTGSGKYGPFYPLQAADTGIRSLESETRSSTYTSGEHSIALCQPLLQLPVTTLGVPGERNLMHQIPSMPRVYDGACLIWLYNSGVATPVASVIAGSLEFAWS